MAVGVPFLVAISSYSVTFAQWMSTGDILTAAHLPLCDLVLKLMLPPEVRAISDGARFRRELARLDPMSRGEKNVLFILVLMLVLRNLPNVRHPRVPRLLVLAPRWPWCCSSRCRWTRSAARRPLEAGDIQAGVEWNALFLVLGGMGVADVLAGTGLTDWVAALLTGNVTAGALPWLAGLVTALLTQFANGPSASVVVSTTLFPIADARVGPVGRPRLGSGQRVHPPVLPALAGPGDLRRVHTRRPGAVARRTTLPRLAQGSVTASAVPGMMRASVKKYSSTQRTDALACRRNGAA